MTNTPPRDPQKPYAEPNLAEPTYAEPTYDPAANAQTPVTNPPAVREEQPVAEPAPVETTAPEKPAKPKVKGSLAGSTWVAMIVGLFLLIALLAFILQNQQPVELKLWTWEFSFPAGVGFLLAAIVGALIMALVGGVRMLELRRQAKKNARR